MITARQSRSVSSDVCLSPADRSSHILLFILFIFFEHTNHEKLLGIENLFLNYMEKSENIFIKNLEY